ANAFFFSRRDHLVALATRYSVPTVYPWREAVVAGGLMSYGGQRHRRLSHRRQLCGTCSQGREARRPAGPAINQHRIPHQSQERKIARADLSDYTAGSSRRGDRMRRREFIAMVGGAIATWPSCVCAEQARKVARIGVLATGALDSAEQQLTLNAFRQGLRERGYVEGQNILVEYRTADGKIERFPQLARELVGLDLDLIVASNTPAARATKEATTTIPIVVPVMGDPVRDGLVASLARPGGNITGLTFLAPELAAKRLELLKQALPAVSRVAA